MYRFQDCTALPGAAEGQSNGANEALSRALAPEGFLTIVRAFAGAPRSAAFAWLCVCYRRPKQTPEDKGRFNAFLREHVHCAS
jgi:hypothetical protein